MKLKVFKQIAFLLVAGVAGLSIGMTIMWNGHGASASGQDTDSDLTNQVTTISCQHDLKFISTVEATCGHEGIRAHYECEKCHKKFRDAAGTKEVTDSELRIDKSTIAHDLQHVAAKNPTCTDAGCHEHWHCANCGQNFHDENGNDIYKNVIINPKHGEPIVVAAIQASCEHAGQIQYYECPDCHKKFSDAKCKNELSDDEIVVAKLEHEFTHKEPELAKSCTENGHPAYYECEKCHKKFLDLECKNELDENNLPAKYRKGHEFDEAYVPDNVAVYQTYVSATEIVNNQVSCHHICQVCGEAENCEGHQLSAFAKLQSGNVTVTYVSKEVNGQTVVDYTVYTMTDNGEIKITLPEIYSASSVCTYQGVVITPEIVDPYVNGGIIEATVMRLNVDFTETNELVLEFDFTANGNITQTIKIVKA